METIYSQHYNKINQFCHICQKETNIRNIGGGRLIFSCPENHLDFHKKSCKIQKPIHWFEIMEDHFINSKNKIISITLSFPNDYFAEFVYENNHYTKYKTIQSDYINLIKLKPLSSLCFRRKDKFPKIEYIMDYQKLQKKIQRLLIFK